MCPRSRTRESTISSASLTFSTRKLPGTDPFWIASARITVYWHRAVSVYETPSLPQTIGEIRRQGMASNDEGFGGHWRRIIEGRASGQRPLTDECVRALYDVIDLAPVTASSVRKTFTSRLDLWANPLLDEATSSDDFDLRKLREKPTSIRVAINPDDLHRLRPIISLFFQQCLGLQTHELPEHVNPRVNLSTADAPQRVYRVGEDTHRISGHALSARVQREDIDGHSSPLATARYLRCANRRNDDAIGIGAHHFCSTRLPGCAGNI